MAARTRLRSTSDGKRAVSVHEAGTVIVWDIESRSVLHVMSGHDWSISSVAISPDGSKAISGSIDGDLKLWDIDAGRLIRSWRGHERGTYGAAFTPDGHEVITGSGDYTIKIWDVETGRMVRELDGHSGTVYALQISPDGKRLVSCSLDGTARLWDIASGDEIEQYNPTSGPLYSVVFAVRRIGVYRRHRPRHPQMAGRRDRVRGRAGLRGGNRRSSAAHKRVASGEPRLGAEVLFDPQHLIPFRHALGAGERANLQLAGVPADREMSDGDVLGFARARRNDRAEPGPAAGFAGGLGLAHRAGLIDLDQHGVDRLRLGAPPRPAPHR